MTYIKSLDISYDIKDALDKKDINEGFGGKDIYLVPNYTDSLSEAACAFSLVITLIKDHYGGDMGEGDGLPLFRYLIDHHRPSGDWKVISEVALRNKTDGFEGSTDDINKGRGKTSADALYLCWNYAKN